MRPLRRIVQTVVLFAVVGAGVIAAVHHQDIYDWARLRNYTAPASVAQIATDDTMTAKARRIFYVNQPVLTPDKPYFNKQCGDKEQTIILGCYHGNQRGIYVYAVGDPRLAGVEQVTSAHEMLHAAYDRLSSDERARINGLLEDFYQHDLQDKRIKDTIDLYKKIEPNDVVNEMHSVFGTEVANLPPALETYYQQYFSSRPKVAKYAATYQSEFTNREAQIAADDARLTAMKKQIDSDQTALDQKYQALTTQKAELDALRSRNIAAYNAGVDSYNNAVGSYNAAVVALKNLIAQYNTLVDERNAIAVQESQLSQALNSQATAPVAE